MPLSNKLLLSVAGLFVVGQLVACNGDLSSNVPSASAPVARAQQAQGGVDGGGGNYIGSTEEQIKAIFNGDNGFNLKETVKDVFRTVEFQIENKTVDPEIENIFSQMLGRKFAGDEFDIYKDIDSSDYSLKDKGTCLVHSSEGFKDASAQLNKKSTSICFSMEGLKKLPVQAVPFQLVALAVHEHAHHYGFDEENALIAQKHILANMNQGLLTKRYMKALGLAADAGAISNGLLKVMASEVSDKIICKRLSSLNAKAVSLNELAKEIKSQFEIRMLVTALDHEFGLDMRSFEGSDELLNVTSGMLAFCGEDFSEENRAGMRVGESDRQELAERLAIASSVAKKITQQIISLSDQRKSTSTKPTE